MSEIEYLIYPRARDRTEELFSWNIPGEAEKSLAAAGYGITEDDILELSIDKRDGLFVSLKTPLEKFKWTKHPEQWQTQAKFDINAARDRAFPEIKDSVPAKIVDRLLEDEPTVASLSDDDIKRALTWLDLDAESGGFFAGDIDISDEYEGVNRTELIADLAARAPNDEPVSEQTTLAELSETYGTDIMQVLLGSRKTMGTPERHQSVKKDIDILDKKRWRAK